MTTRILTLIAILVSFSTAYAQTTTATGGDIGSSPSIDEPVQNPAPQPTLNATSTTTGTNSISAPFKINAPEVGQFRLKAGIKSQNTSGRVYDFDDSKAGTRMKQKHEYYLGFVHANGWGAYGQAVTSGTIKADPNLPGGPQAGDPSVTILHPDWYRGTSLTLSGQLRRYFPVSVHSQQFHIKQWAYYLYTTYQLPKQWSIWNQTVPRYFEQPSYAATDTTYYLEDLGNITKSLSTHWAAGFGQWTQVEAHSATPTGVSVDMIGFVRYIPIANVWIEPRLILPAYIKNAVYDQSNSVSLSSAKAELYAQMTL